MVRMQPLIQTTRKNGSFIKAYKLGTQLQGHLVEAQEAADWLETAIHVCESGECGAHLDRLISVGSKHSLFSKSAPTSLLRMTRFPV